MLTDIARQLKFTFGGFESTLKNEVVEFKKRYGDAESICIDGDDYIVINQQYDPNYFGNMYDDNDTAVLSNISPLFYGSINKKFAVIDSRSSATLINKVYEHVTYLLRSDDAPIQIDKQTIVDNIDDIIGYKHKRPLAGENLPTENDINFETDPDAMRRVSVFKCYLIKDTGVSATSETFSFMLTDGIIKIVPNEIVDELEGGTISLLSGEARENLIQNSDVIRKAVFDAYNHSEMDIQRISIKSIFEIRLRAQDLIVHINNGKSEGIFRTSYFAGNSRGSNSLSRSAFECNNCESALVSSGGAINKIHINQDAYDENLSENGRIMHLTGCADCLECCPVCGEWHYNYKKALASQKGFHKDPYRNVKLTHGREFIRSLNYSDLDCGINYCRCREAIEWVYDTGTLNDDGVCRNVIPLTKMAIVNYACEKIAGYDEFKDFREKYCREVLNKSEEDLTTAEAKTVLAKFKRNVAAKYSLSGDDLLIANADKCVKCNICGGEYYRSSEDAGVDTEMGFVCSTCYEIDMKKRHMLTRIDGTVFLRQKKGKGYRITQYRVTSLGNLKKVQSRDVINEETQLDQ